MGPKKTTKTEQTQHAGPKVWERVLQQDWDQMERKEKRKNKLPWELQHLMMEEVEGKKIVGLPRPKGNFPLKSLPDKPSKSEVGALKDEEVFWKLYEHHAPKSGYHKGIGHYLGIQEAKEFVREAKSLARIKFDDGIAFTEQGPKHEGILVSSKIEVRFLRGSGSWAPIGGCTTDFCNTDKQWKESILAKPYSPGRTDLFLLPLFMKLSEEEEGHDDEELDKKMRDDLDQQVCTLWDFEKDGMPTSVVPARVIRQPTIEDPNRHRAVKDYRYPNAIINRDSLRLPDHIGISTKSKPNDRGSKQDLKTGYHQVKVETAKQHLLAVSWKGRIWKYTCMTYGLRDAPKAFQERTSLVANVIQKRLSPRQSEVYLDDFMQIWKEGMQKERSSEKVKNIIVECGFAISEKKCKDPHEVMDVLGLELNTITRTLGVSKEKSESIIRYIEEVVHLGRRKLLNTGLLAQLLGKLVSVEPAMPHLMLLTRQLFEELKNALVDYTEGEIEREIRKSNDASSILWRSHDVCWSKESEKSLLFIRENWDKLNGQSLIQPTGTIFIRTDASSTAAGGTVWRATAFLQVNESCKMISSMDVTKELIQETTESFEMNQAAASSTAREAWAIWLTVKEIPDAILRNADVVFETDNQGLAKRFWMGSTKMEVNEPLLMVVKKMMECEARWSGAFWFRRTFLMREDELSREKIVICTTNRSWWKNWMNTLNEGEKPTIDLFASEENRLLERYVTILREDGKLCDGIRVAQSLNVEDIPYIFPPFELTEKAVQNWERSESRLAYVVIADIQKKSRTWDLRNRLETQYDSKPIKIEVEVPHYLTKPWTYVLLRLEKKI